MNANKRGITIAELLITIILLVMIVGAASYAFRAVMLSWSNHSTRTRIAVDIDAAIAKIARQLREAVQISSTNSQEVRFTAPGGSSFIYYIDNSELKKAILSGGIDSSFTYGPGELMLVDVVTPPTSSISVSGNMVNLDISVSRGRETLRSKTQVRPRNL